MTPWVDQQRYPYGDPVRGVYDDVATYGDVGYLQPQQLYGGQSGALVPYGGARAYSNVYDDGQYYDDYNNLDGYDYDGYGGGYNSTGLRRRHSISYGMNGMSGMYGAAGYGMGGMGGMSGMGSGYPAYGRIGGTIVKFRPRNSFRSGISLLEAMSSYVRLAHNSGYRWYDLNPDARGRIRMSIRWAGFNSLTYEIPLGGDGHRVDLATLTRRIARACAHFIQSNGIPLPLERIRLHQIEEVSAGLWAPVLTTRS